MSPASRDGRRLLRCGRWSARPCPATGAGLAHAAPARVGAEAVVHAHAQIWLAHCERRAARTSAVERTALRNARLSGLSGIWALRSSRPSPARRHVRRARLISQSDASSAFARSPHTLLPAAIYPHAELNHDLALHRVHDPRCGLRALLPSVFGGMKAFIMVITNEELTATDKFHMNVYSIDFAKNVTSRCSAAGTKMDGAAQKLLAQTFGAMCPGARSSSSTRRRRSRSSSRRFSTSRSCRRPTSRHDERQGKGGVGRESRSLWVLGE